MNNKAAILRKAKQLSDRAQSKIDSAPKETEYDRRYKKWLSDVIEEQGGSYNAFLYLLSDKIERPDWIVPPPITEDMSVDEAAEIYQKRIEE